MDLESLDYIGNFQIIRMEEPNKSQWETPLLTDTSSPELPHSLMAQTLAFMSK